MVSVRGSGRKAAGNRLSRTSSQSKLSGAAGHASSLDRIRYWIGPVAYRWPDHVHQVLSNRAQLSSRTEVLAPETHARNIVASDPIEARAKSDPIAAVAALRLLRRTRELTARHKLNAEEIEESVANQSIAPEAFDWRHWRSRMRPGLPTNCGPVMRGPVETFMT